jgi:hypothetical protein
MEKKNLTTTKIAVQLSFVLSFLQSYFYASRKQGMKYLHTFYSAKAMCVNIWIVMCYFNISQFQLTLRLLTNTWTQIAKYLV